MLRTRVEWLPVVVVAASLCELHSSGAACSKYNTPRLVALDPACNIPMRYTDARDAYVCAEAAWRVARAFSRLTVKMHTELLPSLILPARYTLVGLIFWPHTQKTSSYCVNVI